MLEIGGSFAPIVPKSQGWNTRVVDHASKEELVTKYRSHANVDVSRIEDVDVVWTGGPLHEALPSAEHGTFDACVASHVLEHIPDPIGFFRSLERLLTPTGVVSLVIPDKRYCFDFFKPLSTSGALLAAHASRATRHSPRSLFDHLAYSVTSRGEIAWGRGPVADVALAHPLDEAQRMFGEQLASSPADPYVDCHAWHFTPGSFALALLELAALDAIDFRLEATFLPAGCEFYATLRRGKRVPDDPAALQAARLKHLLRTVAETREQGDSLLAASNRDGRGVAASLKEVRRVVRLRTRLAALTGRAR